MSFSDWPWRHWREQRADKPALRLNDEVLSWQQLCTRIDNLAAGFHQQGVEAGDGVLLLAHNHPQTLLAWLALLQCGARILPVNPQLPHPLLEVLLPQMTLRFALVLDGHYDGLAALSVHAPSGEYRVAWQPERLASMTLTSGSTGLPKAAVHTCGAHLASAEGVLALMPYGEDDDWLLSLPLFHVSGQGILWRWLQAGARLTVREKQPLEQALQGCTHASLVPTQLWRLLNTHQRIALKAVLLGGAAIPVELTQQARAQGISTFCGYGLTEFASTVCAKEADGEPDVGSALPGREVQVVNGEVWIKAQSMASGYWSDGALLPLTNSEGWFATRDRGELHDGRLTILGRMDNLFFSGGEGIQPESLERIIATHPHISQVFIVPLNDAEFGQRPVAVVECEPGTDITRLPEWVQGKLARFEQPVHWLVLPAELKNGGIKISRQALKQWVNAQLSG
ncbi:TPA: o-succinylbenzoate--CoA ligase [Enterobacter cloacae]|uniref:o-succinylbenzoate--CoA ligase n=1 Tax=Enterobacter cloacae complex TaxID=354276 RepID=UPI00073534B1|nr:MULTISPECIES: o-succinylbenzoate--CoA ligase [Enterobacter cloacae complex]KTI67817.1 2-succinylbenzoate-CoA ligase [Enterobacter cloacae subsp. cloacae]MCM7449829.1 o-succinylbenzoate--CoA ligase [Enterobacter cloacae]MDD7872397.1 o-succinylbenzoate--CoA ligase [Enterobacter cloacae complex sp. 2022EL-00981]RTO19368.1 o-succinylbenzoate--CoA ligase [Enterobacter cloacae]RTO69086.1 o-succinylbenzoate--CoA ligase [Enterobacter cloacae]